LVLDSVASRAWHVAQSARRSVGGAKSWGLWQPMQAIPPAWAAVSATATFAWQLVHLSTFAFTSPACGSWHPTHAVLAPCTGWIAAWQPAHDCAASIGA